MKIFYKSISVFISICLFAHFCFWTVSAEENSQSDKIKLLQSLIPKEEDKIEEDTSTEQSSETKSDQLNSASESEVTITLTKSEYDNIIKRITYLEMNYSALKKIVDDLQSQSESSSASNVTSNTITTTNEDSIWERNARKLYNTLKNRSKDPDSLKILMVKVIDDEWVIFKCSGTNSYGGRVTEYAGYVENSYIYGDTAELFSYYGEEVSWNP